MRIISKSIADSQFFSRSFVKYVVHLLFDVVRREIIPRQWSCLFYNIPYYTDLVIPIEDATQTYTLLGVLLALRHLLPQVAAQEVSQQGGRHKGSLGRKVKDAEVKISVRQLQQVRIMSNPLSDTFFVLI